MQESEIWSNPDTHKTLVPLKGVTESIRNLVQCVKVTEYCLCNTKCAITKYINMEVRATTGVDSHQVTENQALLKAELPVELHHSNSWVK